MTLSNHQSRRRYIWGSVAVVVLVALIIVLVTQGRAAAEAQKHDPHGQAAATARSQADFELVKALDDVANQLSLGTPLATTVLDTCRATRPASLDVSITCDRSRFRLYSPSADAADAHLLARRLAPPWRMDVGFCDADLKLDTACLVNSEVSLELGLQPAKTYSMRPTLLRTPDVIDTWVDDSALWFEFSGAAVVVTVDSRYYEG
jgi:hypothetical protein